LIVGAFVVVGLAAVAYLALKIGGGALMGADTYVVSARFANISGLNSGAKVAIYRIDLPALNYKNTI